MNTEFLVVDSDRSRPLLQRAAKYIREGELVAFPTETVYGLGADGLNGEACAKIFEAKHRPADNPLILHISELSEMDRLVEGVRPQYRKLAEELWPGPMTLIFQKSKLIPDQVTAGGDTVAIRMPSHPVARDFIRVCQTPLAAPSANLSGKPSPTNAQDVLRDMDGRIACILDGGSCQIGIESTVIDCTTEHPEILRPGFYTLEFLQEYLPDIRLEDHLIEDSRPPKSPGQKYRHYAPKAEFHVYVGDLEKIEDLFNEKVQKGLEEGRKIGVMTFVEDPNEYPGAEVLRIGSEKDITEMGRVLFAHLRSFDRMGVDLILGVGVPSDHGYGVSIMNRMKKAASGNVHFL